MTRIIKCLRDVYVKVFIRKKYTILLPILIVLVGTLFVINVLMYVIEELSGQHEILQINKNDQNIFFILTPPGESEHQMACAVESAARANPDWKINAILNFPVTYSLLTILKSFPNVRFGQLNYTQITQGNSFAYIYNGNPQFLKYNIDITKLLTIFCYGGVYLDSNVVVLRSFADLAERWVVKLNANELTSAAFNFGYYHNILRMFFVHDALWQLTNKVRDKFLRGEFNTHGIGDEVVSQSLKEHCTTSETEKMTNESCPLFHIYNSSQFLINLKDVKEYLLKLDATNIRLEPKEYVVLVKTNYIKKNILEEKYPLLVEKYCPATLAKFGSDSFTRSD